MNRIPLLVAALTLHTAIAVATSIQFVGNS